MERAQDWVRRKDRHPTGVDAVVHRSDGSRLCVNLTNFCDDGCRIEAEQAEFRIGEKLAIAIPRMGKVKAQVRWSVKGNAGAKFLAESDF